MKAYSSEKLENGLLVAEAKRLFKMKFISKEQLMTAIAELPLLQSSSIFIRFGFFLLGVFLFSSIAGFLSLIFGQLLDSHFNIMVYFYAFIGFIGIEILVKNECYRHGWDDAFIVLTQASFCGAVGIHSATLGSVFAVAVVMGLLSCSRCVKTLSPLVSRVGVVRLFFYSFSTNVKFFIYRNALQLTKIFSLVLAYASVNYMVVRELSESLMGIVVEKGNDIPLAFLFYGLTFLIPLTYIYYSLQKKDRTVLTIGLLTLGYSFFTIRYYYSLMPPEMALVLAGLLLSAISFFAIKKLQHKETGITFQPDRDSNSNLMLNAQALIINSQISTKAHVAPESKMPFGGGGFSGGGAGESF